MSVSSFYEMRTKFPDLIVEIIKFFDLTNVPREGGGLKPRDVSDFFSHYSNLTSHKSPQPYLIVQVCQRLAQQGMMSEIQIGGLQGLNNRYTCTLTDQTLLNDKSYLAYLNCVVYETQAVYDIYSGSVLPIVNEGADGNLQIGSSFIITNKALVTAAHCVNPAAGLSLKGVPKEALAKAKYYLHPEEALDLSIITFDEPVFADLLPVTLANAEPVILEEVMALGYPNVPGYHATLAAEAAAISGRFTAVRGRIASKPEEIFSRAELFLITARVRGGFSGGPVFNKIGLVVGVVSREPASYENAGVGQKYDNLGYGTAIPVEHLRNFFGLIDRREIEPIDTSDVRFSDFE